LFKATLWTRELSLKKSTGIFTYPHQTVMHLFFKPGTKFEFSDWTTPAAIDSDSFELLQQTDTLATFKHATELINYNGIVNRVWHPENYGFDSNIGGCAYGQPKLYLSPTRMER
jgi:hypothetical protein